MTPRHRQHVARVDADRRKLHSVIKRRLIAARRAGTFAEPIERLSMLAYLTGLKRAVMECKRATGVDVRSARYDLSRQDDEDRDYVLWMLLWLGLSTPAVAGIRQDATAIARAAEREIRATAYRRAAATKSETVSVLRAGPNPEPVRFLTPTAAGNVATTPATDRQSNAGGTLTDADVFGRFGRANVPDSLTDTWAETVAYAQFERGRMDAAKHYPAYAEALWGYRWSSILDSRTTRGCRLLDGWIAPVSDTWQAALSPPRHFNCRAVLIPVWESSELRPPKPQKRPPDATLARMLAEKESFIRRLA